MPHGWTGDAQSRLKQNAFPIRGCQGVGSAEYRGYLGALMVNIPAIVVCRGRSSSPLTGNHDAIAGIPWAAEAVRRRPFSVAP